MRNAYTVLVAKSEGRRWEDNIEMDLKEIVFECATQDTVHGQTVVNTAINFRIL
jgi:hypothetical protein